MNGRIPEEKIDEIRERIDIVEVVSSYVALKRSGANHQGLCPFHSEKTPSFNVNAPRQIFHCFGCGVGGNVFSFLMRIEGLSFPEAVRRLGERVGIEVEEERLSPAEEKRREEREQLLRVSEVACEFYHRVLLEAQEGRAARRYLRERGYGGEEARGHRLGFAPARWEALAEHLVQKGFDPKWGRALGLTRPGKEGRGDFDLFRSRLLFPITDVAGRVVAFGGRVLDASLPKYINSPESAIYHKGRVLYGLGPAREEMRRSGEVIVVEGYFDRLALHRAGFPNVVATCGTALTEEHAALLKRYAKRVLLLFDQDKAGRQATFRAMETLLPGGLSVAVVGLDPGEDPDSFLARRGTDAFRARLASARPVFEVYMEAVLAEHGDGVEGKARAVEEIAGRLSLFPGEIERSLYLKELAACSGVDEELLRRKARDGRPAASRGGAPPPSPPPPLSAERRGTAPPRSTRRSPGAGVKAQAWLLRLMLSEETVCRRVAEEGTQHYFLSADFQAAAEQVLRFAEAGRPLDEGLLGEPLSDEQQALLSAILIQEEKALEEDPEQIVEGCRKAVERERLRQRIRELDQTIAEAEAAGDRERQAACQMERVRVNRKLKN